MRILMAVHAGLVLLGMIIFSINTWQHGASFGVGGALMFANVLLLALVWNWLIRKKLVAVGLFVIVTKYALLGIVIYQTFQLGWIEPLSMALGVGTFGLAAVIYGLIIPNQMAEVQGNA